MISWIQKYFQHHFRTIFAILLVGIIIAFVFTIGAAPGIGQADRKAAARPFFGHNLASENEMSTISRETQLSSILHQENSNPLFRLTALHLVEQLHQPGPTESELKDFVTTLPAFADEKGQFDATAYNRFQTEIRKNSQFPEALVRRVIEDDFRINRITSLLGGPGYVQPNEIKTQLERFESTWTLGIANVDYKSFTPALAPTDADLTKFFEQNASRYEIQPQVSVRYAEFSAENYIDKVTVTEAEIKAFYDANPARFSTPQDKVTATPAKPADFASVSLQVEHAFRLDRAVRLATKAASDFTFELYEKKINPGTPAFDALLADRKLVLKNLAPFSQDEPPTEFGQSPEAATEAFKLSKEHPYSSAIGLKTGSAVLFWKDSFPTRQPAFVEVKTKVSTDYVEEERRKRFVDLGKTLRSQIAARLKAGDTFDAAVTSVSATSPAKIEGKTLAPFTVRQRPQDLDYLVFSAMESLKKGDVSEMVVGQDKGLIVYAADKKTPELTETNPQYKTYQTQIARSTAARTSAQYLREVAETELSKNAPATAK